MAENNREVIVIDDDEEPQQAAIPSSSKRPAKMMASKPKKAKKDMPHVLLWVPHHGPTGARKSWAKLKAIGIFESKEAAEAKKASIMAQHDQCGYGDILVGNTFEDEIDLIIKPCELFLDP